MDRKRILQSAGFGIMFVIVVSINFYAFDRMCGLLGLGNAWISMTYSITLTALLIAGFLVRTSAVRGTKGMFVAVTTVYGLEFTALSLLIPFEIVNFFFPLPARESGLAILNFAVAAACVSAVNAQLLDVRTLRLPFTRKLRAVLLSDLHIGAVHGARYLRKVVETVNGLNPDLVLIAGDIVSGAAAPGDSRLDGLAGLKARTVMAPGNHEYYEGVEEVAKALPKNVEVLRDREVKFDGFCVFGLDFLGEQGVSGTRTLDRKFDSPVIMLAHVPQFFDLPKGSIILSGHYHAGQVFPFNFLGYTFLKYFRGLYNKNGVALYVSPGTATWGPPMRFGSRNEITVLELGS